MFVNWNRSRCLPENNATVFPLKSMSLANLFRNGEDSMLEHLSNYWQTSFPPLLPSLVQASCTRANMSHPHPSGRAEPGENCQMASAMFMGAYWPTRQLQITGMHTLTGWLTARGLWESIESMHEVSLSLVCAN